MQKEAYSVPMYGRTRRLYDKAPIDDGHMFAIGEQITQNGIVCLRAYRCHVILFDPAARCHS